MTGHIDEELWWQMRSKAQGHLAQTKRVGNQAQTQPLVAAEHVGVVRPIERGQKPATCYWSHPTRTAKQMLNFNSTKQRMHGALYLIFYIDYML